MIIYIILNLSILLSISFIGEGFIRDKSIGINEGESDQEKKTHVLDLGRYEFMLTKLLFGLFISIYSPEINKIIIIILKQIMIYIVFQRTGING
jgi:hypothetical protein